MEALSSYNFQFFSSAVASVGAGYYNLGLLARHAAYQER